MEKQIEKLLGVLMTKVIEGIPDHNGGYLERPIDTEAKRFIADCGGELDAAVSAAAYDIFVRRPNWTHSVWKGALIVIIGQLPIVGTTTVFCSQFESVWKQLRFVALQSVAPMVENHSMPGPVE